MASQLKRLVTTPGRADHLGVVLRTFPLPLMSFHVSVHLYNIIQISDDEKYRNATGIRAKRCSQLKIDGFDRRLVHLLHIEPSPRTPARQRNAELVPAGRQIDDFGARQRARFV